MSKLGTIALRGLSLPYWGAHETAVLKRIGDCQTPRMGGNDLDCKCGHREVHYNSCRDRHCPLCQGAARAYWRSVPILRTWVRGSADFQFSTLGIKNWPFIRTFIVFFPEGASQRMDRNGSQETPPICYRLNGSLLCSGGSF